ncbi:MAG: alpha/beta hydrolase, partial [Kiritimatiellia bacterium]
MSDIPARPPAKIELALTRLAARWLGRWSMSNRLKAEDLSSDPETVAAYLQDPLVHDRITLQWIREFFDTAAACRDRLGELERPLLLIHGDQDRISA